MYPNIDAEQARLRMPNKVVAPLLGMTPYTYGQKKQYGGFTVDQAKILCNVLQSSFEYLFKTEDEENEHD